MDGTLRFEKEECSETKLKKCISQMEETYIVNGSTQDRSEERRV